jgi:hypothetical protein
MVTIRDVGIDVNITRETRAPEQAGFGSLAFVYPTFYSTETIKRYTSIEELSADFVAQDAPMEAGKHWFGQEPTPKDFYVIRAERLIEGVRASATIDYAGSVATGLETVIAIEDRIFKYSTTSGETPEEIAIAMAELIEADPWFQSVATGAMLDIQSNSNGSFFNSLIIREYSKDTGIVANITQFTGGTDTTAEPIEDTLDRAQAITNDFYAIALSSDYRADEAQMTGCGDWAETREKVFFAQTNEKEVVDPVVTDDMASIFVTKGYSRTCLFYTRQPLDYVEIGAFGILATTSFRGNNTMKTLKFKDAKVSSTENLTGSALATLEDKKCNVFLRTAGIRMIYDGVTPSGEWIDVIHGADALAEEIRTRVFGALSRTATKIPYTEKGMDALKYEVESALIQYETNGYIASSVDTDGNAVPAYEISSGRVVDASPTDKANRIAPDIEFSARLASAVHAVTVNGTLVL